MAGPRREPPGNLKKDAPSQPQQTAGMWVALGAMCVGALPFSLTGALAFQIRDDLDVGVDKIGAALSMFFVASAIASPFVGRVVEHLGCSVGLRVACIISATCMTGIGIAVTSWWALAGFLGLGGIAQSTFQASTTLLVARNVPADRQGFAFGFRQSATLLSTLLAGLAVPLFSLSIGWQATFMGAGILSTPILLLDGSDQTRGGSSIKSSHRTDTRLIVLLLLALTASLGAVAASSLGTFLVDSSVRAGMAPASAGAVLAGASLLGIVVRLAAGINADRKPRGRIRTVAWMLAIGSLGYLCLATGIVALVPLGAVLGFGGAWGWPGLFSLAVVSQNPSAPASATGITQIGNYVGAALGPSLFGMLVATRGYGLAWGTAWLFAALGSACAVFARRLLGRDVARRLART